MTRVTCLRRSLVGGTAFVAASVLLAGWVSAGQHPAPDPGATAGRVTLSIVGTTDLHGRVFPRDGHGGLALLGGYLRNLRAGRVTLSIVGTTDLHGRVFPRDGHGGLALLGGYLRNLRAARAADGGAVLLLDAGDTFQGGIASDISEGLLVF